MATVRYFSRRVRKTLLDKDDGDVRGGKLPNQILYLYWYLCFCDDQWSPASWQRERAPEGWSRWPASHHNQEEGLVFKESWLERYFKYWDTLILSTFLLSTGSPGCYPHCVPHMEVPYGVIDARSTSRSSQFFSILCTIITINIIVFRAIICVMITGSVNLKQLVYILEIHELSTM